MSANMLKGIALIAMTLDHAGLMLFQGVGWMRIVGRIAFPIFAFMIAEGCRYTRNRRKYLLQIALPGIAMQIVFFVATGSLYQSVLISFALSIMLIYVIDEAKRERRVKPWIYVGLTALVISFLCMGLPELLCQTDYGIDYGMIGVLIPAASYFAEKSKLKLVIFTLGLIALSVCYGGNQWFCLLAVPLLGMYNHRKGKYALKYLFHFYYPAHLCVLFLLQKAFR